MVPVSSTASLSPSYYEILGVAEDASQEEIKATYRRLAREMHPDQNPEADVEMFKRINAAYDILSDPAKRRDYDNGLRRQAEEEAARYAGRPPSIRISRPTVEFGVVKAGVSVAPQVIQIYNDGGDCHIEISPDHGTFWTVSGEMPDSDDALANLVFQLDSSAGLRPGDYSDTLFVTLSNDSEDSSARISITVQVTPDVSAAPTPPPRSRPTDAVPPVATSPLILSVLRSAAVVILGIPLVVSLTGVITYYSGLAATLDTVWVKNSEEAEHASGSIAPNLIELGLMLMSGACLLAILPGLYWTYRAVQDDDDRVIGALIATVCFIAFGFMLGLVAYSANHQPVSP